MNKIDTLVIIGNGFDIWQNLNTNYFQFKQYLLSHLDEILEALQISRIKVTGNQGEKRITPVEIIYGKSLELDELEDDFWKFFEFSLGQIDAQYLNLFFDKEEEDLEWMLEMAEDARRIFVEAFNDWVGTLNVEDDESFAEFKREHGLEILGLEIFDLTTSAADASQIKDIYVLGHSLGEADLEYFDFLMDSVCPHRGDSYKAFFQDRIYYDRREWNEKKLRKVLKKGDSMDEIHLRLQYTIKQYGYRIPGAGYQNYGYQYDEEILPEEIAAVRKKYGIEQTMANMQLEQQFFSLMEETWGEAVPMREKPESVHVPKHLKREPLRDDTRDVLQRERDVQWHISCFSEQDRKWAQEVMEYLTTLHMPIYTDVRRQGRKLLQFPALLPKAVLFHVKKFSRCYDSRIF